MSEGMTTVDLADHWGVVGDFWPSFEQQAERGCTCVQTRPATHLEPAEWEQNAYCAEHPVIVIVLATLENALAEVLRLREAWAAAVPEGGES